MASWRLAAAAVAPRTLPPAIENRLRALVNSPELRDAQIGVAVVALGTVANPQEFPAQPYEDKAQPILFELNADKRFLPASNLKLYTAALALKVLGPEKTFATRVIRCKTPPGKLRVEPLYLVGGGDPSFSTEDLRALAQAVAKQGIKRVGGIRADATAFNAETLGGRYPFGWILDDAFWYYGPEISALAFNRNQVDVIITGKPQPNLFADVQLDPDLPGFRRGYEFYPNVSTGGPELTAKDAEELLTVSRSAGIGDWVYVSGQVAPNQKIVIGIAVPHPPRWAADNFAELLREAGIAVAGLVGESGSFESFCRDQNGYQSENSFTEIARHESPPLRILLRRLLKNSDNLYAEMLLRAAARAAGKAATAEQGSQLLLNWLRENGVPADSLRMTDGSGLSRYNLVTPLATAQLLAAVERLSGGDALWDGLPIAGVDGSLKNRMQRTPAAGNVRAKTGTFSIVNTLSGYVTTRDGHRLAVSLLTNFARDDTLARRVQDDFYTALATTTWAAAD